MSLVHGILTAKQSYQHYKTALNIVSGAYFGQVLFQKAVKESRGFITCRTHVADYFASQAEMATQKKGELYIDEVTEKLSVNIYNQLFNAENWQFIAATLQARLNELNSKELNDELYKESVITYYQLYATTTIKQFYTQASETVGKYLANSLEHLQYLTPWISTCDVKHVEEISQSQEPPSNTWQGEIGKLLICAKQNGTKIVFEILKEGTKHILLPYVLKITEDAITTHVSGEDMQKLLKECAFVVVKDIYFEQLSELRDSLYKVLLLNLQNKIRKELPQVLQPIVKEMVVLSSKSIGKAVKISTEKSIDFTSEKILGTLSSAACYSAALPIIQYLGSTEVTAAQLMMIPAGGYVSVVSGQKIYGYFYPSKIEIQKKELAASLQEPAKQALVTFLETTFTTFGYKIQIPDLIFNELTETLLSSGTDMMVNYLTPKS